MLGATDLGLQPGDVIAGKYEVARQLQAGAAGVVYACKHLDFDDHLLAVKVLFPDVASNATACARLQQEVASSYRVTHPNIVRTYEYLHEGELIGYSMEYVDGGDLAEQFEKGKHFNVTQTLDILAQLCAGVQAMHNAGIVHRDLKPENILLTRSGKVKIADFGIVQVSEGPKLTEAGGVVGTIAYMSPEYMLNAEADWRSDIYAIGVLGYEMLTGDPPFRGESAIECMRKRITLDPPPPSDYAACPAELDRVILRALARDPEKRYQSAGEMLRDLQPLKARPERRPPSRLRVLQGETDGSRTTRRWDSVVLQRLRAHNTAQALDLDSRATCVDLKIALHARDTAHYRHDELVEIASLYGTCREAEPTAGRVGLKRRRQLGWAGLGTAAALILEGSYHLVW